MVGRFTLQEGWQNPLPTKHSCKGRLAVKASVFAIPFARGAGASALFRFDAWASSIGKSAPLCDRTMLWPGVAFGGAEFAPSPDGGLEWWFSASLEPLNLGISS